MKIMLKEGLYNLIKKCVVLSVIFMVTVSFIDNYSYTLAKTVSPAEHTKNINKFGQDKINLINKYQDKYFEIVKRHDALLNQEDIVELNNDRKELEALFTEVENQITNEHYLKKYKNIQKRFATCDSEITPDINAFAEKNCIAIEKLLNTVYKKAQTKLDPEDLKQLVTSENNWEKEVEDYRKVYNSMGFGTIGASIYYDYMINMKEFRTLLLMLFL